MSGVIERLFRTLKEQIVRGRFFQTIDGVRDAVREFVARYNAGWQIEKNGFRSPLDARAVRLDTTRSAPHSALGCRGNRNSYTALRRIGRTSNDRRWLSCDSH